MAVLIEGISLVIQCKAIDARFKGGRNGFERGVPNSTFCTDGVFARVGFMSSTDVEAYASTLEAGGLIFNRDNQAVDFAVVDQLQGPTLFAPWLEFGNVETASMKVAACWLTGQGRGELALPIGWEYAGSLSQKPGFVPVNAIDGNLKFLRRENGNDVYLDLKTGKEMFAGRPAIEGDGKPTLFTVLETISHEVFNIDARIQPLLKSRDEQRLAPLFHRLNNELLPKVIQIANGAGREMSIAHFTLGLTLRVLRRREDAESEFRKAIDLQPENINTLSELVRCLGEQDKNEEALPFARKAVELAPKNGCAWGDLAMCLIQCNQRQAARNAIDYAVQLDSENTIIRYIYENFENYFRKP